MLRPQGNRAGDCVGSPAWRPACAAVGFPRRCRMPVFVECCSQADPLRPFASGPFACATDETAYRGSAFEKGALSETPRASKKNAPAHNQAAITAARNNRQSPVCFARCKPAKLVLGSKRSLEVAMIEVTGKRMRKHRRGRRK